MIRFRWGLALVILFLTGGWGSGGHRIINGGSTVHLPPPLAPLISQRTWLADSSSVPDWRRSGSNGYVAVAGEGPKHYLDVDDYPEYQTRSVPTSLATLLARYGSSRVYGNGILPWAIAEAVDTLTAAMQRRDLRKVWSTASDLGHYVADGHNPLHCTVDYNGRNALPGSTGIHSRYESSMVTRYLSSLTIEPEAVHYVEDPAAFALEFVYDAQSLVDGLYEADVAARASVGWGGSGSVPPAYLDSLWIRTGAMTRQQFQRASVALADLVYSAWVDAGSPDLLSVTGVETDAEVPSEPMLSAPYPNPFNPSTTVEFTLTQAMTVRLELVSLDGRSLGTIVEGPRSVGRHRTVVDASVHGLTSGVYFVRLTGPDGRPREVRRLLLLR